MSDKPHDETGQDAPLGAELSAHGSIALDGSAVLTVLPRVPLEVATEPHPDGLRIGFFSVTDEGDEAPQGHEQDGAPLVPPDGFQVYPPAPLTAEEAEAEGARLRAGVEAAARAAWDAAQDDARAGRLDAQAAAARALNAVRAYLDAELGPPPAPQAAHADAFVREYLIAFITATAGALSAELATLEEQKPKKRGRPRRLPDNVPQATYPEIAALGFAVTDVPNATRPTGKYWGEAPGGDALVHSPNRANLQVRFTLPAPGPFGAPLAPSLWGALQDAGGVDTYLLAQVGAYLALRETQVTIALDDLIRLVGWKPRSVAEREEMRGKVWKRLRMIDGLTIHGLRPGRYRDPDTGQPIDLSSQDALFRITGKRLPAQVSFDPEQTPLEVTFVAGPFINEWRGNPQVLTWFGDFLPIAGIPGEQPSGAWARAVGLALNQRWREQAAHAQVTHPGEENTLTVKTRPFTRRELLTLFEPSPTVDEVLSGPNPARARAYWRDAIKRLEQAGVIGHYKETKATLPRYSWGDVWLDDEKLDIRPGPKWQEQAAAIAGAAKKASRRRKTKKT